jgi:hypothetical protein
MDKYKQLDTADSTGVPEASDLSQIFCKLYNQAINLNFHVLTQI